MSGWAAAILADSHANVPSEAVGSGLAVWWLLVALCALLTAACGVGFVRYLRRTAPDQWQGEDSTPGEAP